MARDLSRLTHTCGKVFSQRGLKLHSRWCQETVKSDKPKTAFGSSTGGDISLKTSRSLREGLVLATGSNTGGEIDLAKITDAMGALARAMQPLSKLERGYVLELAPILLK